MTQQVGSVIIFEGPDGAGKSTAAAQFAKLLGARLIHSGPFKRVTTGLGRLYVEAMLPALLGGEMVVLDRAWLSEPIYGQAYRGGVSRLLPADLRMLDRLAWRCGAIVVNCRPSFQTVHANWASRRADELLDSPAELLQVYNLYAEPPTSLNVIEYDYTMTSVAALLRDVSKLVAPCHFAAIRSAGNWLAKVTLVGENFGEVKNHDPLYQWPFASFSGDGCSRWLTDQLNAAGIGEDQLSWVNADQDLVALCADIQSDHNPLIKGGSVIALGSVAAARLTELGIKHELVEHPAYWRRFHSRTEYSLIHTIKRLLAQETT